ncbi:hypothetical protein WJX79_000650 [Trebouxia sp. C0005]
MGQGKKGCLPAAHGAFKQMVSDASTESPIDYDEVCEYLSAMGINFAAEMPTEKAASDTGCTRLEVSRLVEPTSDLGTN